MNSNKEFLQNLYDAFNRREIETIISSMREYWTDQSKAIQPKLETLKFEMDEKNRNIVTVHQIVRDLEGNLLADATVHQIFTIEDDLISFYEIDETETIEEMIQKTISRILCWQNNRKSVWS